MTPSWTSCATDARRCRGTDRGIGHWALGVGTGSLLPIPNAQRLTPNAQPLQQPAIGVLAALEAGQAEELVRRVELLVVQGEGEGHHISIEVLVEQAADG